LVKLEAGVVELIVHVACFAGAAGVTRGHIGPAGSRDDRAHLVGDAKEGRTGLFDRVGGADEDPRLEKKVVKSSVGPLMFAAAPPTQSICATFLPARSAALAIVSA
jgi:hypothetical protein